MNIEQLTAKALVTKIEKLDTISSQFCDKLIAAGRGHERFSEIRAKSDELSIEYIKVLDAASVLHQEKSRRLAYHGKLSPIRH